jgi:hypothetical protein
MMFFLVITGERQILHNLLNKMNDNIRHEPVTSNFCGYDFVSIRVDGVDYFPISRLPFDSAGKQGFPVPQIFAVQALQRLRLEGFQSHKFSTSLESDKVDCISEEVLALVVECYAFERDCFFARQLMRASFGAQLRLADDLARGVADLAALRASF